MKRDAAILFPFKFLILSRPLICANNPFLIPQTLIYMTVQCYDINNLSNYVSVSANVPCPTHSCCIILIFSL